MYPTCRRGVRWASHIAGFGMTSALQPFVIRLSGADIGRQPCELFGVSCNGKGGECDPLSSTRGADVVEGGSGDDFTSSLRGGSPSGPACGPCCGTVFSEIDAIRWERSETSSLRWRSSPQASLSCDCTSESCWVSLARSPHWAVLATELRALSSSISTSPTRALSSANSPWASGTGRPTIRGAGPLLGAAREGEGRVAVLSMLSGLAGREMMTMSLSVSRPLAVLLLLAAGPILGACKLDPSRSI
mmetsp:Transcript_61382/g.146255  ORF Transcript_61382/g.146255 Transcript_61382/m.146255 type:complete len:246 (+) Transcript_61382:304-1041(+)